MIKKEKEMVLVNSKTSEVKKRGNGLSDLKNLIARKEKAIKSFSVQLPGQRKYGHKVIKKTEVFDFVR